MFWVKNIILSFFSIILIFFISYYSFWIQAVKNLEYPKIDILENKNTNIKITEDEIIYGSWDLNLNFLSDSENILSNNEVNIKWKNISLWTWIHLINLNNPLNTYNISWSWYTINDVNSSKIFIIDNKSKIKIFSLNWEINVNLNNLENNKEYNTISLYPKWYITFNPILNSSIENMDILWISQRFSFWFINQKLLMDNLINNEFINQLSLNDEQNEILKNYINYIIINSNKWKKQISYFKTFQINKIISNTYIQKYSKIFINKEKKDIYYKNIIINDLLSLEKINKNDNQKVNNIIENLNTLKEINIDNYKEAENIIKIMSLSVLENFESTEEKKLNYATLINKLENKKTTILNKEIIKLSNLETLNLFLNLYIENKKLTLLENNYKEIEKDKLEYFWNYIKNLTLYWLLKLENKDDENKINDVIWYFNLYTKISLKYYDTENLWKNISDSYKSSLARTAINEYNYIIKKLVIQIEENYFTKLEEESEDWVLVLNDENLKEANNIIELKDAIEDIFDYYRKNKNVLWNRQWDNELIESYKDLEYKIIKYLTAINNYDDYKINYLEKTKWIFSDDKKEEYVFDNNLSINYFKKFNWINKSSISSEIKWYNYCEYNVKDIDNNPYCYIISFSDFWNQKITFSYNPDNWNNIYNIYINWESYIWNDRLDDIEENIEIENKKLWEESENKWDIVERNFYNYFIDLLKVYNNKNNNSYNEETNIPNNNNDDKVEEKYKENETENLYKISKLLWDSWVFLGIKEIINIGFNDITVKEQKDSFDVTINNWVFTFWTQNWLFEWKYNEKTNSFKDVKLLINKWEEYNLWWNKLIIIWEISIDNLEKEIIEIEEIIKNIIYWYELTSYSIDINKIEYNRKEQKYYLYSNNLKIAVKSKFVTSIKVWNEEKLWKTSHIDNINEILNDINN